MSKNKVLMLFTAIGFAIPVSAQMMTVTEATLKQSEIARAEFDARLEDARGKSNSAGKAPLHVERTPTKLVDQDAEGLLSLISVYGVGHKLKADFLFRGAVVTLEAGGNNEAAGWRVEKLTQTDAVLVRMENNKVTKRNTVYLSPASNINPSPAPSVLPSSNLQVPAPLK